MQQQYHMSLGLIYRQIWYGMPPTLHCKKWAKRVKYVPIFTI